MKLDVTGRPVQVGDTIVRAKYARDSRLHFGKVTEVKDSGAIKMERYHAHQTSGFTKSMYDTDVSVQTQFLILDNIQL